MSEEANYDDLDAPQSPSLWELITGSRSRLCGAGLLLSLISFGACAATVVPDSGLEVWRTIITAGTALLAVAAFVLAVTVKSRS